MSGAILFSRNVESPAQVAELTSAIKQRASRPFLTSVDQEGGNVARLRELHAPVPAMQVLGAADDAALSEVGKLLGRELRAVSLDLDYAPVLDVNTNPDNPVSASARSATIPTSSRGTRRLSPKVWSPREWPLAANISRVTGTPFEIRTLHCPACRTPSIAWSRWARAVQDRRQGGHPGDHDRARRNCRRWTRSGRHRERALISGLLRGKLGYEGLVVTDDLEMKAITTHYPLEEVVGAA